MKYLVVILVLFPGILADVFATPQTSTLRQRPNVILIMVDDAGWECFGPYGAEDYQTPNIDALGAKGIRFESCFSTPICTPSRVEIMTGKYSFRNYTHFGYLDPKEKTFGHMLQAAGYKTAIAGKWQLNGLYHKADGADDNMRPVKAGFDEYCLWQLTKDKKDGERYWSPLLEQNGKLLSVEDNAGKYGPDIMSDFVCDFIERHRNEPFFVYYPTVLVHTPFVPTPDTIGSASRSQEANRMPADDAERKKNFVAMIGYMDKIVGKIIKKVEDVGRLENTVIILTADNGIRGPRWQGHAKLADPYNIMFFDGKNNRAIHYLGMERTPDQGWKIDHNGYGDTRAADRFVEGAFARRIRKRRSC